MNFPGPLKIILLAFCFFSLSVAAGADQLKIRAAFTTWEPYGYLENGKATGFEIEIFRNVMDQMGIPVTFVNRPWKRCLFEVSRGQSDAVISALQTPEREKYMFFPKENISTSCTALFTVSGKEISFDGSFESLKPYTISITDGFSYGSAFDAAAFLQKEPVTTTEQVVAKVLLGRNDIGIGDVYVINAITRKMRNREKIRFLFPLVHTQKLYVGFSKANGFQNLTNQFSNALSEFKRTDEYLLILKKYGLE